MPELLQGVVHELIVWSLMTNLNVGTEAGSLSWEHCGPGRLYNLHEPTELAGSEEIMQFGHLGKSALLTGNAVSMLNLVYSVQSHQDRELKMSEANGEPRDA